MIEIETAYEPFTDSCILKIRIPCDAFGTNRFEKVGSLVRSLQIFLTGYLGMKPPKELSEIK